ncbi:MAG: S8 family serine peptidase, partial [Chloroflexi bacterium]|nr:S8 family serine peptidase [Chloroflexota bacterium]
MIEKLNTPKSVNGDSKFKRLSLLVVMALLLSTLPVSSAPVPAVAYVEPGLLLHQTEQVAVIVTASDSQSAARAVEQFDGQVTADLWLINAVAANLPANRLSALAAVSDIQSIVANKGVQNADGPFWPGYNSNARSRRKAVPLASAQATPVTFFADGAFISVDVNGNVKIVNADGSQRFASTSALTGGPFNTPVVAGLTGKAYFAGQALRVYALNSDGSTAWQYAVTGSTAKFPGGVALAPDGTVYAVDSTRTVHALDGATGQLKWKTLVGTVGAPVATPAAAPDGSVTFATDKGYVYALNADGSLRWSTNTAVSLALSPVIGLNGTVYVASGGGKKVLALDGASGAVKYTFAVAGTIGDEPVVALDGSLFVPTEGGFYGLNANGTKRFVLAGKFKTTPALALDGNTVYASSDAKALYALDTSTGARKWTYADTGALTSPTIDLIGNVIVGSDTNNVTLIDPTGRVVQRQVLDDKVTQAASVLPNGNVVVRIGSSNHSLVVLGLLPSVWNAQYDVLPNTGCNWPIGSKECFKWRVANPTSIDVGADQVQAQTLSVNGVNTPINGAGVTVAVVDTGAYLDPAIKALPGLSSAYAGEADFVDKTCNDRNSKQYFTADGMPSYCFRPYLSMLDPNGHGSHIASTIQDSLTDVDTGVALGIAPGARILAVRVLGPSGTGTYADVIAGIQHVVANKANPAYGNIRVMNLSLSALPTTPYFLDPINRAAEKAWQSGIVVLAAAGNAGPSAETITVPGNDPYVITVGAVRSSRTPGYWFDDSLATWSSTGPTADGFAKPDVVAPGSQILGWVYQQSRLGAEHSDHQVNMSLFRMSGTSMSAGIASGVVALMLQANPALTPDQVKFRLKYTARPTIANQGDPFYSPLQQGTGRIWAPDAVLGTDFPAGYKDNADMDINGDLAHNETSFTYHYPGAVQRMLSDDGQAYLYYSVDATGKVLALGATQVSDKTWLDRNTIDGLTWNQTDWSWASGSLASSGGYAWNGGGYAWNGGGYAWNGGGYAWNGGGYAWNGGGYAWNGGGYAWNGGTVSQNG